LRASRFFWFSSAKLRCFISTISFTFSSIYEHQTQLSNSSFLFVNTANVPLQSNAGPNSQSSPKDLKRKPQLFITGSTHPAAIPITINLLNL
jgi:hypothetical protein